MRISHKERQPSRYSRKQRIRSRNFNPSMMKNLMWKKQISIKKLQKGSGKYKRQACLSNVLTVARLAILQPSVPIPRRTLKMKKKNQTVQEKGKTQLQENVLQREKELLLKRRKQQFIRV
jgi:hypothetical protein